MSRKARTPEEQGRRDKIRALLQERNVTSRADIQNLGSTDKFSTATLAHLFLPLCVDKASA